ncbi:hypothetical protein Goari_025637, partial [Gossypium aridum]|nr:hypothetical protein [Gossypium aridum]
VLYSQLLWQPECLLDKFLVGSRVGVGRYSVRKKRLLKIFTSRYCCRKLSERNWRNLHARDPSQGRNRMLVQGVLRPMVALPLHREHLLRKYQPISTETTGFSLVLQPLVLLWDGISTLKTRSKRP